MAGRSKRMPRLNQVVRFDGMEYNPCFQVTQLYLSKQNSKHQRSNVSEKIHIVGVADDGIDGLTESARQVLGAADLVIGPQKTLALVQPLSAEMLSLGGDLAPAIERIEQQKDERIVLLTLGDPLFYGTARFLCDHFGKERFEILPHVSVMQLAFARVKESWDEAYLANLATSQLARVVDRIRTSEKVGLFTSETVTPRVVAEHLLRQRIDYFSAFVCENIGSPDERVTQGSIAEIAEQEFSNLNVMILIRQPDTPDRPLLAPGKRLFGNPDDAFLQSQPKRGLLTPAEVRSLALAELHLTPDAIVWDVGAGSGSVSVEAAQLAHEGTVFAIEMDPDDHRLIAENVQLFGVRNVVSVLGEAPQAFDDLPGPNSIFVGGSGRMVPRLVEASFERLVEGGRIVVNVNSIENLTKVRESLDKIAGDCNVWMLNLARGTRQMELLRFEAVNPTYLLSASKKG